MTLNSADDLAAKEHKDRKERQIGGRFGLI